MKNMYKFGSKCTKSKNQTGMDSKRTHILENYKKHKSINEQFLHNFNFQICESLHVILTLPCPICNTDSKESFHAF